MDGALFVARLVLAVVFLVAALGKLADRSGSRQAAVDFGVPVPLAGAATLALPLAELAVAVLLVPTATARTGAAGALVLLSAFMVGIGVNLARGRRPDCHCFGQLHSTPIGAWTLARNAVLAATAAAVAVTGPEAGIAGALGWVGDLSGVALVGLASGMGLCFVAGVGGWLVVNILRQNGRILLRLDALEGKSTTAPAAKGLPVGLAAPSFELTDLEGQPARLRDVWGGGRPVMLVFVDPRCGSCKPLLSEIGIWREGHADRFAVALVSGGSPEANQAIGAAIGAAPVLLEKDREVSQAYRVAGTPSALMVRPDGRIGSRLAAGADAIRGLVTQELNGGKPQLVPDPLPKPPAVGDVAPDFELPGVYGRPVPLARFRGKDIVLVFWSPSCGFCQKMLPDLRRWEDHPPPDAPQLLLVSSGTVEANRDMGVRAPIVLQNDFAVGRRFGTGGTPSGILLDADGRVASELVVGAPDVLGLLRFDAALRPDP